MSGPIVRTGTTPEFWKNWDQAFGNKTGKVAAKTKAGSGVEKSASAAPAKKVAKKTAKSAPAKAVQKKAAPKKAAAKKKK